MYDLKKDIKELPAHKVIEKYEWYRYERKTGENHLIRQIVKIDFHAETIFRKDSFWTWLCSIHRFFTLYNKQPYEG